MACLRPAQDGSLLEPTPWALPKAPGLRAPGSLFLPSPGPSGGVQHPFALFVFECVHVLCA